MPSERRLAIRYKALHRCLSKGIHFTAAELRRYAGDAMRRELDRPDIADPSLRTLKEDLKRLREGALGDPAPIRYDRSYRAYHYTESYNPYDGPLSTTDYRRLREAVAVLEQVQGRAPLLDLEDILFRLRQQLDDPEQDLDRIIRFEITGIRRGREHLAMLYRCVRDRQCLYLDYQAFYHDTPQRGLFTPLLLKRYNRRWFLLGWDHTDQRIETRPLDRILGFELAPNRPQDPPARFYESWLANVVGVTRLSDAPLEEVVVRVGRALAPYWTSKPLHPTQAELRDRADDTHRYFRLRVYPNYELESQLLAFGEEVEVVEPVRLRTKLRARLLRAADNYR